MRDLYHRAAAEGRLEVLPPSQTEESGAAGWSSVLTSALQRVALLEKTRHAPNRPAAVDVVVPLCSPHEIDALSAGLRQIGDVTLKTQDPNDGWASGTSRARSAREHARIRGHWRHAHFQLCVYTVCGDIHVTQPKLERLSATGQAAAARLSQLLFADWPGQHRRLFGGMVDPSDGSVGLPHVQLDAVEEEVPTGDVAAYLQHLAQASATDRLANITFLLHPDFLEHVRAWKLHSIFASLANGAWPHEHVEFLYLGWRHEGPVEDGRVGSHLRYHCDVEPRSGGKVGPCDYGYNPRLLQHLWRMAFGRELDPSAGDDLGGYDFSQLLVSRRAVLRRPAAYWRYLAQVISARFSYELLPRTRFISRRTDLSQNTPFNKGVCAWFEHMWHLLLDPRFFPDAGATEGTNVTGTAGLKRDTSSHSMDNSAIFGHASDVRDRDLRAFTHLSDQRLPLGLRNGPDSVMGRHYWFSPEEQCAGLGDEQGCRMLRIQHHWRRQLQQPQQLQQSGR